MSLCPYSFRQENVTGNKRMKPEMSFWQKYVNKRRSHTNFQPNRPGTYFHGKAVRMSVFVIASKLMNVETSCLHIDTWRYAYAVNVSKIIHDLGLHFISQTYTKMISFVMVGLKIVIFGVCLQIQSRSRRGFRGSKPSNYKQIIDFCYFHFECQTGGISLVL